MEKIITEDELRIWLKTSIKVIRRLEDFGIPMRIIGGGRKRFHIDEVKEWLEKNGISLTSLNVRNVESVQDIRKGSSYLHK